MATRKRTVPSESVFLDGIEFRRYPDAKNYSDRIYFRPGGSDAARGVQNYHRELYKKHHGPIPEGFDVHHKDSNALNNALDNLELKPKGEHKRWHADQPIAPEKLAALRAQMDHARVFAADWHSTPEGLRFHAALGKKSWDKREFRSIVCQECGKDYQTRHLGKTKFCSGACKSRHRDRARNDNETRVCATCGKEFQVNRYSRVKNCSRSCGARGRVRNPKGSIQSSGG